MSVTIRKADRKDASKIAELESRYIEVAWSHKQILDSMDSGLYDFFVAELDGEIASYAFVQWCLDEGNICNVCTDCKFRNTGLATGILNTMQEEARQRGVKTLLLEVNQNNSAAIALYKRLGFEVIYTRANYYGSQSALIMQKTI